MDYDKKMADLRLRVFPIKIADIVNSIIKKNKKSKKNKKEFLETLMHFYNSETYRRLYEELLKSNNPSQVDYLPFKKMFMNELENLSNSSSSLPFQINYKVLDQLTVDKDWLINLITQIERFSFYKELSSLEVISLVKNKDYQIKYIEIRTRLSLSHRVSDIVNSIIGEDKKNFVDVMLRFYNSAAFQSLYKKLYSKAIAFKNLSKVDYLSFKKMFLDEIKNTPEYIDPLPFQMDYKVLDELDWGEYHTLAYYIDSLPLFIENYGIYKGLSSQEVITLFKKKNILEWLISNIDFLCHYGSYGGTIKNMIDENLKNEDPSFYLEDLNDLEDYGSFFLESYEFLSLVLM